MPLCRFHFWTHLKEFWKIIVAGESIYIGTLSISLDIELEKNPISPDKNGDFKVNDNEKVLIFFGAGASAPKVPVQSKLFEEYYQSISPKSKWKTSKSIGGGWETTVSDEENAISKYEDIIEFFKKMFGIDFTKETALGGKPFPTFEEIYGILSISAENGTFLNKTQQMNVNQQINGDPRQYGSRIENNNPNYTSLMANFNLLLRDMLDKLIEIKGQGKPNFYKDMVSHLMKSKLDLNRIALVSLNYDLLLDTALLDVAGNGYVKINYQFPFTPYVDKEIKDKIGDSRANRYFNLFKLHGSLNWLYCPYCEGMMYTGRTKGGGNSGDTSEECDCGTMPSPLIIPPTYFKNLHNTYIQMVWHSLQQFCLDQQCKTLKIIFCGYSFPEADIDLRYLLKRIEMNYENPIIIKTFNKECNAQEMERYRRFFRTRRVSYNLGSFEDFSKNPIAFIK